jgi:hypothetical protein
VITGLEAAVGELNGVVALLENGGRGTIEVTGGEPMKTIHVRTKVESDTLHLPELKSLIGKPVEVFVVELAPATREEFYPEVGPCPQTAEERAAEQAKLRGWRADPRFERFWPTIDRILAGNEAQAQAAGAHGGQKGLAG